MKKNTIDLLLLGVAHSLNHSLFLVLPPLMTTIADDLNTSFGTIGIISTITFLTYGAGALIGGPLSDRIGSLKVAQISIGLGGLMSLVFLLANNVYIFGAGMFLMALWASFYHPTANGLIAKAFPENTGGSMGIHNAAGNFGQVFTPTLAFFLGIRFSWRISFVVFGLMSVLTAVLLNRIEVNEGHMERNTTGYLEFIKTPGLWIVLVYNILVGSLFRSVDLFFPSFLSTDKLYTGGLAAIANSMILFFGVLGQLAGGRGSDRFGSPKVLLIATSGMVVSLLLLMVLPTNIAVPVFVLLYGISMFGHQPTVTNMVSRLSPRNMMGLAYGVMFFSAFGVGSISTSVTGWLADQYSLTTAFWVNTGLSAVLLLISVVIYMRIKD
ncbi:MAG: MFS transporter [Candidatus Bathyarchaeota archaeon]|nr:MFS transporter [Candidatus Bathyarchaeota archaeon]